MKELLSPQTDIKVISSPSQDQRKRKMHSEHKQKCPNIREFPISRWHTSSLGCIEYHVIVILCIMHHVYAIKPTGAWMLDADIRCSRYFMRRTFKEGATHTWAVPEMNKETQHLNHIGFQFNTEASCFYLYTFLTDVSKYTEHDRASLKCKVLCLSVESSLPCPHYPTGPLTFKPRCK